MKDASEIALWNVNHNNAHDNDNSVTGAMEMRMMLGTNSKHIILTLVFEDLTHFEINALKTQVLTYCSVHRIMLILCPKEVSFFAS